MREDIRDALQVGATASGRYGGHIFRPDSVASAGRKAVETLRQQMLSTLRELPDDMSVRELREELEP